MGVIVSNDCNSPYRSGISGLLDWRAVVVAANGGANTISSLHIVTDVLGIKIPSVSPIFFTMVGLHALMGLACVIAGIAAMLSEKGKCRHTAFGTIYFWCLAVVFVSAAALSIVRWTEDYHLFVLGAFALATASFGRSAMKHRWPAWVRLHIGGMGASYILLLTAFYVDNGENLPGWKELPVVTYWTVPAAVGIPIIVWAMLRHPLAQSIAPPTVGR
jgi:uncharacterized membrane protein